MTERSAGEQQTVFPHPPSSPYYERVRESAEMEWIRTSPIRYRDEGRNLTTEHTVITMKTILKR